MDLFPLILVVYLVCHSPAIITTIIGLSKLKKNPSSAKKFLIFSGIYFLVGAGICGSMLV